MEKDMIQSNNLDAKRSKCQVWRFFVGTQKFFSLFSAKEIIRLVAVFFFMWGASILTHRWCCGCCWTNAIGEGFRSLFSANHGGYTPCAQILLGIWFFVVWLIGGGVLVSVMVMQQRRNENGEFRLRKCLLRDHVVFLGWDENVPSLMNQELHQGNNADKKIFIVVTMTKADDVIKSVVAADIEEWRLFVYRGFYDDNEVRKKLNIENAQNVYIMGESREEAHDSRVILHAKNLSRFLVKANHKKIIFANIKDFGLACRLKSDPAIEDLKDVNWINFHLDSSCRLLSRVKGGKPFSHVAVIGFGAMGKAVVVNGLSEKDKVFADCTIYVSDDDEEKLVMEKKRFDEQFPQYEAVVNDCPYAECLDKMRNAEENERWLVVVAKHRSEKGFAAVLDVLAAIKGKTAFRLALNQEVKCDYWHDVAAPQDFLDIDGFRVELFGFKSGDFNVSHN